MLSTNELKKIIAIPGVTFDTKHIENYIIKKNKSFHRTNNGNIYWGSENPNCILIAHIDEVGFEIKKINSNGTLQVQGIGWVNPGLFAGQSIIIKSRNGKIYPGIVIYNNALRPQSLKKWNDITITIGYNNKKSVEKMGIKPGCYGTYYKQYFETSDSIIASTLDNRLSVWLMLELIKTMGKTIKQKNIGILFSIDEEEENTATTKDVISKKPQTVIAIDVIPHSLGLKNIDDTNYSPWILYKTSDYKLKPELAHRFTKIGKHHQIISDNKYLKKSEPYKYEVHGTPQAANILTPILNYHHNLYSVQKNCIQATYKYLQKLITTW